MPGNEVGDKVHNFFALDNLSQGQHHSQGVDGNWPGGNNPWAGSQAHMGLPTSNSKNYNLQQSDTERGHSSHSFPVSRALNFTQPTLRPEPHSQQTNLNGYVHGHQILQTRQNSSNFLGVDTESDRYNKPSRGFSIYESQQGNGSENRSTSVRSESSESPVSFDIFGSQQQMSVQQTSMLQSLPRQQSELSDMQLLQQQVMLRKMQELQRRQQIQQLEATRQNSLYQIPSITNQASVSHSPALINGTPVSPTTEASNDPWATEPTAGNTTWLQRAASAVQGSSNGFRFSPEQGQSMSLMGLVPPRVDQSLYGVPISNTKGTHQYSHVPQDKPPMRQMPVSNNSFPGNQFTGFPEQVNMQEGSVGSRQVIQGGNLFGHDSGQCFDNGMNLENLPQVNALQRNAPLEEFHGRQELVGPSVTMQERTGMQVSSSQNAVSLDPTEQKILFGDDNIWDAFGSSVKMGAEGFNVLNDTRFLNGLPSMQSGSWSALMQSAVAETTSNDIGLQEEWSGLSSQNTEVAPVNRQPSRVFRDFSSLDRNLLYAHGERLQMDSSHRSIPQSSEEGSKWKALAKGSKIYGDAAHSLDAEMTAKSTSRFWAHQQKVSSHNFSQPQNKPNDCNVGGTVALGQDAVLKARENENKFQHLPEKMSHGGHVCKAKAGPNSTMGLEHGMSLMGSSQVNRENSSSKNLTAIPNSSTGWASQETGQLFPSKHHFNHWKHTDSSMKSQGRDDSRKTHDTENCDGKENSSDSHSSNLSQRTATGGTQENVWSDGSDTWNLSGGKQKLSSQAGQTTPGPQKFQYHPLGNLDKVVERYGMEHATHQQVMSQQSGKAPYSHNQGYFGKANFFGQFPKTSTEMEKGYRLDLQGSEKEVDDAPPRGTPPGFTPYTSAPFDRSVSIYEPNKATQSSQNMLELLHKVDQSLEHGNSDGSVDPLQQNQSSASHGFSLQLAPPSQRLPIQNHALASPSSAQAVGSLSSFQTTPKIREKDHTSLASTTQAQSLPSFVETSQGEFKFSRIGMPGQTGNEATQYGTPGTFSSGLTFGFPHSRSQIQNQQMIGANGRVMTNHPMNLSFDRHPSHYQQTGDCISIARTGQSTPASLSDTVGSIPHDKSISSEDISEPTDTNCCGKRVSAPLASVVQDVSFPQPSISSEISREGAFPKMVRNAWTNVPGQHHLFGAQPHKFPPRIFRPTQSNSNTLLTSSPSLDQNDQNARKKWNGPSEIGVNFRDSQGFVSGEEQPAKESLHQLVSSCNTELAGNMTASQGKESLVKNLSEASPSNSSSTQRDIEAFGRSLRPNNLLHPNYSLVHQILVMKSTEIDPSDRSLKRLKRADIDLGSQITPKSGPADTWDRNSSSQLGNAPSEDVLAYGLKDSQNYSHCNTTASVRVEPYHISPQMTSSFNQFGTFTNGEVLPTYDARKNGTVKIAEQPFTFGMSSDNSLLAQQSSELVNVAADSNQVGNIWQRSTPPSAAIEHFSTARSLSQDVTNQSLVVVRPKKWKSATSELVPWHKEVKMGSQSLLTISAAEVEWAKAANRLIDKVVDDDEMIEDRQPVLRPKRRLILTTQSMQQLFRPPRPVVISADSSSSCETAAYLVARLALGDACSSIPCSGSNSCVPPDSSNLGADEHKTSKRPVDQQLYRVVEDFISRARKLENDFTRWDKRTSVFDLRIENLDLEKFSVINRFAKFYGRGPADGAETSSSSNAAANAQRPFPQRYVTALPMPRNLPDRVQCLSLDH
ncbi:dentin sialophosphoprotein-like protein [Actinidia rufa]|uniref:Dentin sialophosphoprotein-like protein n=1 Tax=Actinidia rufa TaxID=165716 RepID=A0A7J0H1Q3_9ERIC|nr:dentin sialophosphoprotein-like protein [Actinidia rufa]